MSRGLTSSLIVVLAFAVPVVISVDGGRQQPAAPAAPDAQPAARGSATRPAQKARPKPAPTSDDYQIPAGAVVPVTLRTTVGSATSAVGDQVDAELSESISRDGVELIPAGSAMRGSVIDVLPASRDALRGRVAIAFFVIEHARTGSRAAIKSRPIAVDASQPVDKRPVDLMLAAGHHMRVVLAEPLLVRIPR